jgi:Domain of unknown function (DUF1929)/Carboxypeptidase regulatory-like domain/Glyoxal oxidase N-terminus
MSFLSKIVCRALVFILIISFSAAIAAAQSTTGQWTGVMTWPSDNAGWVPTHAMLMPNGKVLYISSYGDGLVPRIFDPATNSVTNAAAPAYNLFCAGHSHLADGRLFITGGHIDDYQGYAHASIYDPNTNTFTQVPDMNAGRWYPTNTTLANGDVLVVSGDIHGPASGQVYNETPQVYQAATNTWRTLTGAVLHQQLYPFMFLAPNGKVFMAGWNPDTRYLNTSGTGAWSFVANSSQWRNYGSAVMYDVGKILIVGGGGDQVGGAAPTNTAEVIDLNAATPAWHFVASMHNHRRQANATILPDGTVLETGGAYAGSSTSGNLAFDNWQAPVYAAEDWNPATNTWTVWASAAKYRGYHSFALLLPDGRVLTGGGQLNQSGQANGSNAEIFSPPYLFKGTRPTITSAPTSVTYGQTALIGTPDAIARATWIRLGAVTHAYNQDQRFVPLTFTAASGGVNVTFPSSANISPPGYYMLFLLNSTGVPSVAKIIKIGGTQVTPGSFSGTVTDTTGAAIAGATVSFSGGSTTTSSTGTYSFGSVTPGTYNVTASKSGFANQTGSVTVASGQNATLNFQLTAQAPGSFGGTVTSTTGAAIAGATVSFSGGSTTTSSTGSYSFASVAPGTYNVTAAKTGFASKTSSVTVASSQNATLNFQLAASSGTGTITGKVTNASTGGAVSGATVGYSGGSTTTSSTGTYTLASVAAGTYTVSASHTGYLTRSISVTVTGGQTTTANIAIATAGKIAGTIKSSSGAVRSGVTVKISGGSVPTTVTLTTSSTGTYATGWIPVGSYTITASKTGLTTQSKGATVNSGATTTVNFTM